VPVHNVTSSSPLPGDPEHYHYVRSVSGTWHREVISGSPLLDERAQTQCHRLVKVRDRAVNEFDIYSGMDICCECTWPDPRPWRRVDKPVRRKRT